MPTDPVCNSQVSEEEDSAEYEGQTYYFCCDACKDLFLQDPQKYLKGDDRA